MKGQHTEQRAWKRKSILGYSNDYDQQYSWQTFENETEKGNYRYWLQEHDIIHIARVEFGYDEGYRKVDHQTLISEETKSGKVFYDKTSSKTVFVVSELSSLPKRLANFKDYIDERNELRTFTTILNIRGGHWVALVVANRNGQHYAYYSDSFRSEIIPSVKKELKDKIAGSIDIIHLDLKQQEDEYNCGIFALQNAYIMNEQLQKNKPLDEMIKKLSYKLSDEEMKENRKHLVGNLLKDHERKIFVIVNFAIVNKVETFREPSGPDLDEFDQDLLRKSLDLSHLLKSSIKRKYLKIATFALERGADTNDLSIDGKKQLSDYIRKYRIKHNQHINDFLSTVHQEKPNVSNSEVEQASRLSADRVKRVDNDPNQEGSSQQSSSDNVQSGRGNINSVQHQQINPNSPDFIDSDDEREKNKEIFSSMKNGNVQKVQGLLKAGIKVNIIDKNNKDNTPLHYPIEKGKKEIAKKLLQDYKAGINAKNNKKELMQLFANKKAKTDIKNNEYRTPLDTAKRLKKQDIIEVLEPHIQPILQASVEQSSAQQKITKTNYEEDKLENSNPKKQTTSSTGRQSMEVDHYSASRKRSHEDEENALQVKRLRLSTCSNLQQSSDIQKNRKPTALLTSYHGIAYQMQWTMVLALEAQDRLSGKKSGASFRFRVINFNTEDPDAGKLDDLVWRYETDEPSIYEHNFLQAKHKLDKGEKVTFRDLIKPKQKEDSLKSNEKDKRPFSLEKFFLSYRDKIKKKRNGKINKLIIATNIDFDNDLRSSFEPLQDNIPILNFMDEGGSKKPENWMFKIGDYYRKELAKQFKSTYDSVNLIEELLRDISRNGDVTKKSSLSPYFYELLENKVINKSGKLDSSFINNNGLSQKARRFREFLLE